MLLVDYRAEAEFTEFLEGCVFVGLYRTIYTLEGEFTPVVLRC